MFTSLALVVLAGLLGPLLAAGRRPRVPVLVGELIGGAIIGRTWLHLVDPTVQPFTTLSQLGFAMLMLLSGSEVDYTSATFRRGVPRGLAALGVAAVLSLPAGFLIGETVRAPHPLLFFVLLFGSSAAVAYPVIREYGLQGASIELLMAWIAIADAITALLMPLTITGAGKIPLALLGDAAIIASTAIIIAVGDRTLRTGISDELTRESKQRFWALQLRASVLLLLVLGAIAQQTGGSLLIAGFAAGIVLRRFREPQRLELQLTGLASGFLVPAFFVLLGATLDLQGLIRSPSALGLALLMAAAATSVHLAGALLAGREHRIDMGLLASAQLGLPAAAAALGLSTHTLSPPIAAALVAGGLLTLIPATTGAILLRRAMRPQAPLT